MTAPDYADWVDSIGKKASRYSILFLQLGAAHQPARRDLETSVGAFETVESYMGLESVPTEPIIFIDALENMLEGGSLTGLGPLRDRVMFDVDRGCRVVLISRAPRAAYPQVAGSSLLEDARFVHGPHLEIRSPNDLPTCVVDGLPTIEVLGAALNELGAEVRASLDRAIYENMLGGDEALALFSARELEALDGAGLTSVRSAERVWNFPKHLAPLKLALDDVIADDVTAQAQLGQVSEGLWTIERSIRSAIRHRAIVAWGTSWRTQCLTGDQHEKVLDRAAESAYLAAKSLKELRDPLEWLSLGELLDLRARKEIGNLGLKPALWRQFSSQVLPIRNRLSHMRTLRPQDSADVTKWLRVIERKLTAEE